MLIQEKIQKQRNKRNTTRITVRINPYLNMKMEDLIKSFQEGDNLRTSKNEIIRIAVHEYLKNDYKTQTEKLQKYRKEHEYVRQDNMNVNEKMLQEITNTLTVLKTKKPLTKEEKELKTLLENEREKLFKDLDI